MIVRSLDAAAAQAAVPALAEVLLDCVDGGASVSFMADLTRAEAEAFFAGCAEGVASGERKLLVAVDENGRIVGTVQLIVKLPPNQPHRAEVAKMLVHRSARRKGVGAALMRTVEDEARAAGKWLLVLDTVTGSDGEKLYTRLGWRVAGVVPDFALWPDGRLCATTYLYRRLAA
jgi:GNAT superfamily N-acetyltransferase